MKSILSIFFGLILVSAGCESTSATDAQPAVEVQPDTDATGNSSKTATVSTDYSDIKEIGDISGDFTINGNALNANRVEGKYVHLFETEGKNIFSLDSCKISGGKFTFNIKDAKIGIYRVGQFRYSTGDFIINPEEKEIDITVNGARFENTIKSSNSAENKAYVAYKTAKSKNEAQLKSIRQLKASKKIKLEKIEAQNLAFKGIQDKMADENAGTFFAKMVRRFQSPNKDDKNKYWNDIDFEDSSLIRSMVLNDRIQDYMRKHGKGGKEGNDGFFDAVDFIYAKSSENEELMNFMLYTMMEGFYSSNMVEASNYIVDNYIHGDGCGTNVVSDIIKEKADGLRSLAVGQTPPDFSIKDENGKMITLSEVTKKNDLTLVLFWASWCHKCEQEMPVVKRIYDQYHSKGFEIIGVSVDMTKQAWLGGIKAKQCDWINVSQLQQWESPVAKDYRVSSTPVMFLMDNKGKLVLRPDRAFKLENWMKANYN